MESYFHSLFIGLVHTLEPVNFLMIVMGLAIGIVAGALPGITFFNAIIMILPFTYLMSMIPSILLLTAIYCGGVFGGSITGILFNIPGDPMNVPTTWEGFKLNKKGEVAKALGMAIMCSAIGGFLSAVIMATCSPPLAKIALSFSSAEYFSVVFLGLVTVVVIGQSSFGGAMLSLFIGMFLGTVGMDSIYGALRFTFGFSLLDSGINFIDALIGMFAIGEVLEQVSSQQDEIWAAVSMKVKTRIPRFMDYWSRKWTIFRGLVSGTIVGIIPAAGATVASFVSYGIERSFSKTPEKFGTGHWEGLMASETAINASTGGAMITLLTLGIPGSGATAVILGAFILHGAQPGPLLFVKSPDVVYTIFVGMLVTNLVMILGGLACAKAFAHLMRIPQNILMAFIVSFCLVGAYAMNNSMADVWFTVAFGIIGFICRRLNLPTAPMILGLILGPLAERFFMTTMMTESNDWTVFLRRPISGTLIFISVLIFIWPFIRNRQKRKRPSE